MMWPKCIYCGKDVSDLQYLLGKAIKFDKHTGRDRYAHTDCGKENTMNDQTELILGAADSAHQGIGLAISLLQESLGNMGEILTAGCMELGPASLGSTMRLGQSIKEVRFILDDILQGAHGLCVLLGKDLEVRESEGTVLDDLESGKLSPREYFSELHPLLDPDYKPGEDEYNDDDQPF